MVERQSSGGEIEPRLGRTRIPERPVQRGRIAFDRRPIAAVMRVGWVMPRGFMVAPVVGPVFSLSADLHSAYENYSHRWGRRLLTDHMPGCP